ncbi:gliding motility-associated peptidyl-prolyl isomerase GldI [Flavobacterium lindanitolerans]|jgi:gliding motility-associated peptidyl-prolyl isomerase|uniref:gliding motility-associated peptidyl-prolyl isomerase GldI n=1 Tax=Flavobacterium lindanitolerans TaxID=428988 RepID=UPI0023F4AE83|nr:gliding motility-associated peptidyl-prolyl isomerase GldI [Flavobacterium lindanitolerans]MDQ7961602.1 gliding motility-associated peptidyl-prolyl isomerase GldI [Flavobacterium lindanitolerans]
MKFFKLILGITAGALLVTGCTQQQARKPISNSSGTFMKESVERNKKLIAGEEAEIEAVIKKDTAAKYIATAKGYWYKYDLKSTLTDTLTPKKGDVAYFDYEVKDLNGNMIYTELELRPQVYRVDKQNIMMGMRDGIKLMKKGEKLTFLFPSHMGYGYHGDNRRIGHNQPLMVTITLRDIKPEKDAKAASKDTKTTVPLTTETPKTTETIKQ